MSSNFYNLVNNTESAYSLNSQNLDYKELIGLLNNTSKDLKYYSLLNIEKIQNTENINLLFSLLKNQDSRIRELSSGLIKNHFVDFKYRCFFDNESFLEFLINSLKDTNPNVCRNISNTLHYSDNKLFILKNLIKLIEIGNITTIYWSLSSLENVLKFNNDNIDIIIEALIELISKTSKYQEYQLREKTAFIVKILNQRQIYEEYRNNNKNLSELFNDLSKDENFYVRNAVL